MTDVGEVGRLMLLARALVPDGREVVLRLGRAGFTADAWDAESFCHGTTLFPWPKPEQALETLVGLLELKRRERQAREQASAPDSEVRP